MRDYLSLARERIKALDPRPLLKRLSGRLLDGDSTLSEFGIGLYSLILGLVLVHPADTFGISSAYASMEVMPEAFWGTLFLGHFYLGFIAWAGQFTRLRELFLILGVGAYLGLLSMLVSAEPLTTGWSYLGHVFLAFIGYLRLRGGRAR